MATDVNKHPPKRAIAIVLAAGFSKRFGSDKRLCAVADHTNTDNGKTPLLQLTLAQITAQFEDVFVVHRSQDDKVLSMLQDLPVIPVAAPKTPIGLGVSLATAAKTIIARKQRTDTLWVFLADMPDIQTSTISALFSHAFAPQMSPSENLTNNVRPVIRPRHQGIAGHPVCFPGDFLLPLSHLEGDQGAAQLIKTSGNDVSYVDVDDSGVLFDIDTQEQLNQR